MWKSWVDKVESQLLTEMLLFPEDVVDILAETFAQIFVEYIICEITYYIEINGENPEDWSESYYYEEE